MTMGDNAVTLVAVLPARPLASLTELVTTAAGAGATAVMVALAGQAAGAARLPFELADFAPGAPGPSSALSRPDVEALLAAARTQGVELVVSVADDEALTRVSGVPLTVLHLPAAALLDLPLVSGAAGAGVPLWLDTAMASIEEVAEAVAAALKVGGRVLLLHGLATAPGRPDEINLRALATLSQRFRLPVGFQTREVAPAVATASVALGATVLAVPFSDDGREGFDAAGLAALHADVRLVARALGDGDKRVQPSEWAARDRTHRSLVARVDIARGRALTEDMLAIARPGIGLKPRAAARVIGRRATVDIPAGTLITLGMLE
jgi:N,N'-diacetyllegionaminate synthase